LEYALGTILKSDKVWKLRGDLTISHLDTLLADTKNFPSQLKLDFSEVTNVDTATVSLIFEWLRLAKATGCQLKFSNVPQNLNSLINLYGAVDLIPSSSR
jgi:phospholipid transport system transporter-binding protein